jgi:ribosomal protein S21
VISLIVIKRKQNEGFDRLARRFNRSVQLSGVLTTAKKKRYFEKDASRSMRRESAKRRSVINSTRNKYE